MKENLNDYLLVLEQTEGQKQRGPFKRKRGGQELTQEQIKAIKKGRKLLRKELKARGLPSKEDFELTASSMGLYLDKSRSLTWLKWLFFGQGIWMMVTALVALLIVAFGLSLVAQLRGHFTINMSSDMFREGFVLSETEDFSNATTHLFCTPAESVPCVSIAHIPLDIDEIDGQHNDAYFAYTFYIRNEGESTVGYEWQLALTSESQSLADALWVMVFENGEMLFYARPNEDGDVEALPAFDDDSRGYLDMNLMHMCRNIDEQFQLISKKTGFSYYRVVPYSFETDQVVARGVQTSVSPGTVNKYTVVIWLEGDDPDCTDDLVGGHAGMDFDFYLTSEGGDGSGEDEADSSSYSFWEDLWNNLIFWD